MNKSAERAAQEVAAALEDLQAAFDGRGAGPSGLRAQAMAHLRQALLVLSREDPELYAVLAA